MYRFVELLPDTDGLVMRTCHHKIAVMADGQRPYLAVMAVEFLYVLKLSLKVTSLDEGKASHKYPHLVTVPVLQHFVFAYSPEVVGLLLEQNLHDVLFVGKY